MIAFEIEIDGKKYVTAGVEDWSVLALHVTGGRGGETPSTPDDYLRFSVGGLTLPNAEDVRHHFRWKEANLQVGSTVSVRIIDVPEADAPIKRYRSDAKIQESPFTEEEIKELRYQDYLQLKAEFEPPQNG